MINLICVFFFMFSICIYELRIIYDQISTWTNFISNCYIFSAKNFFVWYVLVCYYRFWSTRIFSLSLKYNPPTYYPSQNLESLYYFTWIKFPNVDRFVVIPFSCTCVLHHNIRFVDIFYFLYNIYAIFYLSILTKFGEIKIQIWVNKNFCEMEFS